MPTTVPHASRQTGATREVVATFRAYIETALGDRVRIARDDERWTLAAGRLGRLEWRGAEWATDEHRVYVFTAARTAYAACERQWATRCPAS
jgi:hypothetical protein